MNQNKEDQIEKIAQQKYEVLNQEQIRKNTMKILKTLKMIESQSTAGRTTSRHLSNDEREKRASSSCGDAEVARVAATPCALIGLSLRARECARGGECRERRASVLVCWGCYSDAQVLWGCAELKNIPSNPESREPNRGTCCYSASRFVSDGMDQNKQRIQQGLFPSFPAGFTGNHINRLMFVLTS